MSVLNENQLLGASAGGDYEIEQSLRFNGVDSPLARTFPSAGNLKTWTWSAWVKRGKLGGQQMLFAPTTNSNGIYFESSGILTFEFNSPNNYKQTTAVFRDLSAWYHIVAVWNTASGTAEDRIQIYINGERVTSFSGSSLPSQNRDSIINSAQTHNIGDRASDQGTGFDGYIGEVNFIDGQALTADSFGTTGKYGEWIPTKFAGTYGTNGFYLPFKQDYSVEGFSTVVYEGASTDLYVGGTGFQPDFVWIKKRNATTGHTLTDAVRGISKSLFSDGTDAEDGGGNLNSFAPDGFVVDAGSSRAGNNGDSYVAWNWDMGSTTASNTSGSINSSVRASQTYGQSIVSYTGNGTSGATVGHGLASAPTMVIAKVRNNGDYNWNVYHSSLGNVQKVLHLDLDEEATVEVNKFNGTAPSSTLLTLGNHGTNVNTKGHIAYCFHDVAGYSKFSTYEGTGGTHAITLGFSPAFVMIKNADADANWTMWDNTRNPNNPVTQMLRANTSGAEETKTDREPSFTATGFTIGDNDADTNNSGKTYVYMAFADTREYAYWLDQSGNNNDWTSTGSLTESDIMPDTPTNNFCTWNPIDSFGTPVLSEGNLKIQLNTARCRGTQASQADGKIYFEIYNPTLVSNTNVHHMGLASIGLDIHTASNMETAAGGGAVVWTYANANGRSITARQNGSTIATVTLPNQFAAGDIIAFASDSSTGKVWMSQNNSWLKANGSFDGSNALSSSNYLFQLATGHELTPLTMPLGSTPSTIGVLNCGQDSSFAGAKAPQGNQDSNGIGDFFYQPPSGFLALCTANLPLADVIPSENFNTVLYTGTGSPATHTLGFRPNLVWGKRRSADQNHWLINDVGNINKRLASDTDESEQPEANGTTFNATSFTTANNDLFINNNSTYVVWGWKGNGTGTAVSNTNGAITSSVSANPSAGFSIVTYSGASNATSDSSNNSGAYWTIGHGLSKAPEVVLVKTRSSQAAWYMGHQDLSATPWASGSHVKINTSEASANESNILWGNAAPTSTVFKVGGWNVVNRANSTYLAYCFHSVDGYSKVGKYVGNAGAFKFVYCGFAPAVIITKSIGGTGWRIIDNKRTTFNPSKASLYPDSNSQEYNGSGHETDFLSNGFRMMNSNSRLNTNNQTYIFIAFAENPFKHTNAR